MSDYSKSKFVYSICIPSVYATISERRIRACIDGVQIGVVARIDIVPQQDPKFNKVFIHFSSLYENEDAIKVKELLDAGESVKVIYDDPWYWLLSKSKCKSKAEKAAELREIREKRAPPRLEFPIAPSLAPSAPRPQIAPTLAAIAPTLSTSPTCSPPRLDDEDDDMESYEHAEAQAIARHGKKRASQYADIDDVKGDTANIEYSADLPHPNVTRRKKVSGK